MKNFFILIIVMQIFIISTVSACVTERVPYIDNKKVQVWATSICPQQKLEFHTHNTARVIIPASDGAIEVIYKNDKRNVIHLKKGIPVYLSKKQGDALHQDVNLNKQALKVWVISIK